MTAAIETRRCNKCGRQLPMTNFDRCGHTRAGKPQSRYSCRQCMAFADSARRSQRRTEPPGAVKACSVCGVEKPVTAFYRTRNGRRMPNCKRCYLARRARRRQERMADPVQRDQLRERQRGYDRRYALNRALRSLGKAS